nr:MAG TPA: hypothetical protein [Bacteriophage sp.]
MLFHLFLYIQERCRINVPFDFIHFLNFPNKI